jgi:hypothetical protein
VLRQLFLGLLHQADRLVELVDGQPVQVPRRDPQELADTDPVLLLQVLY